MSDTHALLFHIWTVTIRFTYYPKLARELSVALKEATTVDHISIIPFCSSTSKINPFCIMSILLPLYVYPWPGVWDPLYWALVFQHVRNKQSRC